MTDVTLQTRLKDFADSKAPYLIAGALALAAFALIGDGPAWVTLTVAGLAMGLMIFLMASGLTLVFGLMDILNFGHGAFISVGAFVGATVMLGLAPMMTADSFGANVGVAVLAALAAMVVTGALGWFFERVIVRPVYGAHLKQILVTMGGLIVAEQLLLVIWGPDQIPLPRPETFKGAFSFGEIAIEKYRLVAVVLGLIVFAALTWTMKKTKIGLLIRAGVENREMVEALGYRIRTLFVLVFVAGSALAGLGGVMWALYEETVTVAMGMDVMISVFIVIIIGGMGSVEGCFIGALLVGLMANYTGYLAPKVALGSSIFLMVAILMWRPKGLFPLSRR